jgi:DNA-binding SARP family transcriptional activator/tetratricopeptide (TPR) repeat protein/type II secretory pathway predicted ATPase ExeA
MGRVDGALLVKPTLRTPYISEFRMQPRRYLRCLGQPALFGLAGESVRFRTRKHLALLVYLAVEGRPSYRRDRLAEFLWPKVSIAEGRHSLATALSVLRPRLGPDALVTDRENVALAPGIVSLDVERLLAGDVLGTDISGPLQVSAFLDGFDITDSGEFGLWKDRQQARLLPDIKNALVVLIDRCRRTGASREIEQLADRMLALDDLSEEAIRAKMEARAFAGDRLSALQIFEAWKGKLGSELEAAPSDLVEGMAARLRRRDWERIPIVAMPTVPTDLWRDRPFVGRATEYRTLYEAWEHVRTGSSRRVLVLGDSGIGKTTLVSRLTTAAGLEGAAISRAHCYDLEREIPYATLGNLIHGLLDRPGASATAPEVLAELARTVPEVRRRFPSIPPSEESHGETARIRLTESFQQLLVSVAEEQPLILVIDDLHLADDASLAVLHLATRRAQSHPIMVVLIARPAELSFSPHAARIREAAHTLEVQEVELGPLSAIECRELLRILIPEDQPQPEPSIRRMLLHAAGGFPMVLELLVKDWHVNRGESFALALEAMTEQFLGQPGFHTKYLAILSRLVASMDAPTRNILNLAALLGHRLDDLDMYTLLDLSASQCVAGLAQLTERRVLRDYAGRLEFVNELMRAHAYASIPPSLRKALHGAVADRLLINLDSLQLVGLEVAWHCTRAGRVEEATPHLLRGARHAISRGAPYEAEQALVTALPHLPTTEKAEATLLLAEVLQEQGRWQDSLDQLKSLTLEPTNTLRDEVLVLEALAKLNLSTSSAELSLERLPEIANVVQTCPVVGTRIRASKAIAYLLERLRDEGIPEVVVREMEALPIEGLAADSLAELCLAKAALHYRLGNVDRSRCYALQGLDVLRRQNSANLMTAQFLVGLGALDSRQGTYEAAVGHLSEALGMAQRLGNDTMTAIVVANLALCLARLGRFNELDSLLETRIEFRAAEVCGFHEIQIMYATALGYASRGQGKLACDTVSGAEVRFSAPLPAWMVRAWTLWKADVLMIAGKREEAHAVAEGVVSQLTPGKCPAGFAGPYGRWIGVLGFEAGYTNGSDSVVRHLIRTGIERFDAMDQAEILCASRMIQMKTGRMGEENLAMLGTILRRLPAACTQQLVALGALPAY